MSGQRVPVLLYHCVADDADPRFSEWAVAPELFGRHMDALAARGYRALTVRELGECGFGSGGAVPERSVAITFDDGLEDFYTAAWPHLRRHGLTATLFVTTGYVGQTSRWLDRAGEGGRPMMSWGQIAEVAAAGIECGAHGHSHAQLDAVPARRLRAEIEQSRLALQDVVGSVDSFAYPHGYHSRRARREVRRAGFSRACAVADGIASASDDPYAITRAVVRGGTSVDALLRMLDLDQAAPRPRPLRRAAWRAVRRAGAEPVAERVRRALPRAEVSA